VGAVAGATAPAEAERIRALLPESFLLVPGLGAQGARPEDLGPYFLPGGRGAVVNASRSIIFAHEEPEHRASGGSWVDAVRDAALRTRDSLEKVRRG
jgi:orotidine-5'-phosphate decarboxylase